MSITARIFEEEVTFKQQGNQHESHRSGEDKWTTSRPALSMTFISNGLSFPQQFRVQQHVSSWGKEEENKT